MDLILLEKFESDLKIVKDYILHIELINDLANLDIDLINNDSKLNTFLSNHVVFYKEKKAFEYKSIIISVYGILEKYVELFLFEYLDSLSKVIKNYNQLSSVITRNHFLLSLELLKKIDSWSKFDHLEKNEVLNNLNDCSKNPNNYVFNKDAFVLSSNGNLKHLKIVELFSSVDVELNFLLKNTEKFKLSKNSENTFNTIDELVERRNDIAHGADRFDRIDNTGLYPFVEFLEIYFTEIFYVLREDLNQKSISHHLKNDFEKVKVLKYFPNKSVLGFEMNNYNYLIGQSVYFKARNGKYFESKIINFIEFPEINNVTIEIFPFFTMGSSIYIKKQ